MFVKVLFLLMRVRDDFHVTFSESVSSETYFGQLSIRQVLFCRPPCRSDIACPSGNSTYTISVAPLRRMKHCGHNSSSQRPFGLAWVLAIFRSTKAAGLCGRLGWTVSAQEPVAVGLPVSGAVASRGARATLDTTTDLTDSKPAKLDGIGKIAFFLTKHLPGFGV